MQQMLDHHGFCELEMVDFYLFYNDSGAIGRDHEQLEANPGADVNRPWGGVGEGSFPLGLLELWDMARNPI